MTLAEMCETSTSYIGQIEIGNRFPSLDMIEKMAKALKVKPYLLFADGSEKETTEKLLPEKKDTISKSAKAQIIKRLNVAIQRVVKQL